MRSVETHRRVEVAKEVRAGILLGPSVIKEGEVFVWKHSLCKVEHDFQGPKFHQSEPYERTRIRIEEVDTVMEHHGLIVAAIDIGLWPDEPETDISLLGLVGKNRLFIELIRGNSEYKDPLQEEERIDQVLLY